MRTRVLAAAAAALLLVPALAGAQNDARSSGDDYDWRGRVPQGAWLRIANLNGRVEVTAASGDEVEVHATKRYRRGNPDDVRFEMVRDGDNVVICALWSDRSSCDADGAHYRGNGRRHSDDEDRNNDLEVEFTVKLPRGVRIDASTVNGAVDVRGARAQVVAHTVNGRVDASTSSGPVDAETVNGSVYVTMDAIEGTGDMEFSTVNGSVHVTAPANLAADVSMSTVNGSLTSDFPLTIQGRLSKQRIRAAINGGGRQLKMSTVNGSIELRKGQG